MARAAAAHSTRALLGHPQAVADGDRARPYERPRAPHRAPAPTVRRANRSTTRETGRADDGRGPRGGDPHVRYAARCVSPLGSISRSADVGARSLRAAGARYAACPRYERMDAVAAAAGGWVLRTSQGAASFEGEGLVRGEAWSHALSTVLTVSSSFRESRIDMYGT